MKVDEKIFRWVDFVLRAEFNRLWESNSLPFASDQKTWKDKEEEFVIWKNSILKTP